MNHIVYFVGGPLDLTKRAFPGETPNALRLRFPVMDDLATFHDAREPIPFTFKTVEYELSPIRRGYRSGETVAWTAVYVE